MPQVAAGAGLLCGALGACVTAFGARGILHYLLIIWMLLQWLGKQIGIVTLNSLVMWGYK